MNGKKLYLLAMYDRDTQCVLTGHYEKLRQSGFVGTQTKNIPYHITLGSDDVGREAETLHKMASVCSETARIAINLAHIGLFGAQVLFIAPNMNLELQHMQRRFFANDGSGYHSWSAHTTLLIDEPKAILAALPLVVECFTPVKAYIESIALYEFFPARLINECRLIDGRCLTDG